MSESIQLKPGEHYERREDMSPEGRVRVLFQDDGDVILSVLEPDRDGRLSSASVEFCACGAGGGRSPRTRAALLALALAIVEDNSGTPSDDSL